MSKTIIFDLKDKPGYFDASKCEDNDLSNVPKDTICLSLENAIVTDKGIENLPHLEKLRCLDLDSTKISDKALDKICTFTSLEEIWIEDTEITDIGFKKLALLPKLKYVSFFDTNISDEACEYVLAKKPNVIFEA